MKKICNICHIYKAKKGSDKCKSCSLVLKWMVDDITKKLRMKYYDKN